MKQLCYSHTVEYYTAMKMSGLHTCDSMGVCHKHDVENEKSDT